MLEIVRQRLRGLVKLIELKRRPIVYTDFEDEIGAGTDVAIDGISVSTDMEGFRRKARHFLKDHKNHIAILNLRRNEPLTSTDLAELERMFLEVGSLPVEIEQLRAEGHLGLFVRSLVGMDREAAKVAIAGFLNDANVTGGQIAQCSGIECRALKCKLPFNMNTLYI
jgi:type I restriction enzyme R subunit